MIINNEMIKLVRQGVIHSQTSFIDICQLTDLVTEMEGDSADVIQNASRFAVECFGLNTRPPTV